MSLRSSSSILVVFLILSNIAVNTSAWDYDTDDSSDQIIALKEMVSASSLHNYTLDLVDIAEEYPAFRVAGSRGANATADYVELRFEEMGLNVTRQAFPFLTWDLGSKASLSIDEDGDPNTTGDIWEPASFQTEAYSWPTKANGSIGEAVVLPLPEYSNYDDWSSTSYFPFGLWSGINMTDKVVIVPSEIRWNEYFTNRMISLMQSQQPTAVIWVWYFDWMEFADVMFMSSAGGRPMIMRGPFLWDLGLPSGSLNFEEGRRLMEMVDGSDPVATMKVDARIAQGEHYNIIGVMEGTENPERELLLTAHYDSVLCEGYVDNAAGVGSLLEVAKVMTEAEARQIWDPKYSIKFIAFAAEELGMIGSLHYLSDYGYMADNVTAVLNLDCVGSKDMAITQPYLDEELELAALFQEVADANNVPLLITSDTGSDHDSFIDPGGKVWDAEHLWDVDIPTSHKYAVSAAVMVYSEPIMPLESYGGYFGAIHTSKDSPDTSGWLNPEAHTKQTIVVLEVAAILSSGDPVYPPIISPFIITFVVLGVSISAISLAIIYVLHRRGERQGEEKSP
ncbi:MAG TPA: M28 family peptidase [Methanomassiliicoccales archaeon]|nr:M28 family peptidase [Methanomassiliicoccales archaeon]